jgi:xylulokinase
MSATAQVVLGVDSSTQSTKVEARDLRTGELVAAARAPHPSCAPPRSEQDPSAWWVALVSAVRGLELAGGGAEVAAVSVAAQQHGLVVTDDDGDPVRPAKLWNDTESAPQAEAMVADRGPEAWARAVGSVPVAAFTLTKLAWLAEQEPGVLAGARRVFLPHDWLTFRLCGAHVTDRGDASGTGWFDPAADTYRPALLPAAAQHLVLPRVLAPDEPAGLVSEVAARELGLSPEVLVAAGTGDNMAAALGFGLEVGDVAVSLGTSGTVYAVSSTPTADPTGAVAGFADATGRFLPLVCTLNATRVTDTVARWLDVDASGLAELALAADPHRAGRPELVPYFDGERTPNLPEATGSLLGLRNDTTREDLALAAHDGVLSGLLHGLDALRGAGVAIGGRVHLVGGGARSPAYRARLAELVGDPIAVPSTQEAVATGAAVQGAVVAGTGGFAEVADRWGLRDATLVTPR